MPSICSHPVRLTSYGSRNCASRSQVTLYAHVFKPANYGANNFYFLNLHKFSDPYEVTLSSYNKLAC